MISIESVRYSLRNLKQNKGRSILTISSIMVGIATIFIFISFGYGLYNYTNELTTSSSADKVFILPQAAGGIATIGGDDIILNDTDVNEIEKAAGVYEASGLYYNAAVAKQNGDQRYTFIIGYDPKKDFIMSAFNIDVDEGRLLRPGDMRKVVLGYNYKIPNKIFPKTYGINDNIEINGIDLKVIGIMEEIGNPQDDSQFYISNDQFEEMFPDTESYGQIIARVNIKDIEKVNENIERNLRKSRGLEEGKEDFYVQSFDDLIESFSSALNIIIGFIILIALISVLVSTINTANTMITSVLERYKEIGVLKAMGAKNYSIFEIFLFESAFLGLVAGALGVALGWAISSLGGFILKNLGYGFLQPYFSIYLFTGLILFAGATGAISGVFPAVKASKTNPVDALRKE